MLDQIKEFLSLDIDDVVQRIRTLDSESLTTIYNPLMEVASDASCLTPIRRNAISALQAAYAIDSREHINPPEPVVIYALLRIIESSKKDGNYALIQAAIRALISIAGRSNSLSKELAEDAAFELHKLEATSQFPNLDSLVKQAVEVIEERATSSEPVVDSTIFIGLSQTVLENSRGVGRTIRAYGMWGRC